MHESDATDDGRTDPEPSPSCGYAGVLELCHAPHGNAAEPVAGTDAAPIESDVSAMLSDDDPVAGGATA